MIKGYSMLKSLIISLLLLTSSLYSIDEHKIPPSLLEWKDWVLDDVKSKECPIEYRSGKAHCSWYRDITLSLNGGKLDFNMSVTLFQDQSRVLLPLAHQTWVEGVRVNGKKAVVLESNAKATLILDKGSYRISGVLPWREGLKYLQLPPSIALVNLYKNGLKEPNVSMDKNSRLWLDKRGSSANEKGSLSVSIYRKVIDGHPLRMKSYLHISVSGKMRSVVLDGVVVDGFLPTSISSALDATITEDKKLNIEVKAGEWIVTIDSYAPNNLKTLHPPKTLFTYDNQEIWSLQSNPNYRSIEIEGARAIDPSQTTLPKAWKALPAYLVEEPFMIKELYKSAKQQGKNSFNLKRQVWLDFDGGGYTISDTIDAKISQIRRLEAQKSLDLASVSLNSKPTLITKLDGSPQKGVELRQERLNIEASSRYEGDISLFPASGWDEKFDSVHTILHLPIGWKLFASFGSDAKTSSWVDEWNLMDIFLLMLMVIAIYKMYGWRWALPALGFIVIFWHESGAPTLVWLFVLLLVALLRVLPQGKLRSVMKVMLGIVMVIVLLKVLSFSVYEIRTALYPQLEKKHYSGSFTGARSDMESKVRDEISNLKSKSSISSISSISSMRYESNMINNNEYMPMKKVSKSHNQIMQNRIDPNAVVQTGIAKPTWSWKSHHFKWQSAVGGSERLELWLISPLQSKILKVLNILAMFFLLYMFLHEFAKPIVTKLTKAKGIKTLGLVVLLSMTPYSLRADIPSNTLLEELKTKLTTPATCLPHCATIEQVAVDIKEDVLGIQIDISVGADVAVPILGNRNIWLPSHVTVDNNLTELNIDKSGGLWIRLTKGVHQVRLMGIVSGHEQIMLSSTLTLHNLRHSSNNKSWKISSDYKSYIEINNLKEQKAKRDELSKIEPMVEVKRTLYFGQRWYIDTEVKLLNSIERPHTLLYKLLPNESIFDKEIELKNGKVMLHFSSKNSRYAWRSSLPITQSLELDFEKYARHIEVWQMDIASIWDLKYQGMEPIEQLKVGSILMPRFKPWQGDKLTLTLQKAKAVSGESLTIESSKLKIKQSGRYRDMSLDLQLKSSKAGQYTIHIDRLKKLKSMQIDGKNHYIKINKGKVSIPLQAKVQKVKLTWREESASAIAYQFPKINLNKESVNSSVTLSLPRNRWVLWSSGPTLGPAVLLWGVLLAIGLFALILGRIKGTPLQTRDWLLLGLGVSTTSVFIMLPVVVWIFALRFREQKGETLRGWYRNLTQVGLVLLSIIALSTIVGAVSVGLLGNPDMMITGNGSYGNYLNWYSDRIDTMLAQPTVLSVSIWFYRALMLVWAIWIAFSLIGWLKWTWEVFSQGDMWVKSKKKA